LYAASEVGLEFRWPAVANVGMNPDCEKIWLLRKGARLVREKKIFRSPMVTLAAFWYLKGFTLIDVFP
jgi:hypothetical protein